MASIVRNHKVNVFGSSLNAVSAEAEEPATVMRAPGTAAPGTVMMGHATAATAHMASEAQPPEGTVVRPQGVTSASVPSEPVHAKARRLSTPVLVAIIAITTLLVVGGIVLAIILLSSSETTVPDLVGIDAEDAQVLLQEAGLFMDTEEISYPDFREGEVVSQVPAAGQKVDKGAVIAVEVNTGGGGDESDQKISGDDITGAYTGTMDTMISELVSLEAQIKNTATMINNNIDAANYRMKQDVRPQCDALMNSLNSLNAKAAGLLPPQKYAAVHQQFIQLVGYCIERVNAFYAGMSAVESGGDYQSAFGMGVAPKNAYNSLFPSFQAQYSSLKAS